MSIKKAGNYKGRVLFLHGFTQSSSIFYAKTSALRKKLQALQYQAVYLNAPLNLTPSQLPSSDALSKFNTVAAEPDEDTNYRAWWYRDNAGKITLDSAIDAVKRYIDNGEIIDGSPEDQKVKPDIIKSGDSYSGSGGPESSHREKDMAPPIVGLIGFSQGACLAGALAETFEDTFGIPLEFAILYSGFKLDTKLMPQYDSLYTKDGGESSKVKLLHVIGELDTIVGDDRAYTLYDITKKNSHVLKHPGGHFVPNSKSMVNQVTNWIQSLDTSNTSVGSQDNVDEKNELDDILDQFDQLGK